MDIERLKQEIQKNLDGLQNSIPDVGVKYIDDYIQVGEYKLALELLCNTLYEYNINISQNDYSSIIALCEQLAISENYWKTLRKNIITN